jgi:protein-L-isoaspartate O-methyltransferase
VRIDGGPYVPTPAGIVARMLELAAVRAGDVVYDLGSGDGRLVIEAAKRGARGVGVEREARLVALATANAAKAGVAERVRFTQDDLFNVSVADATVLTLYLLPRLLVQLAPKLRAELKPGTRIVSHDYPFESWTPERLLTFDDDEKLYNMGVGSTALYLYRL